MGLCAQLLWIYCEHKHQHGYVDMSRMVYAEHFILEPPFRCSHIGPHQRLKLLKTPPMNDDEAYQTLISERGIREAHGIGSHLDFEIISVIFPGQSMGN